MKKNTLILVICFGIISYGQDKKSSISSNKNVPSISNLKLGLDENYITEKYGLATLDNVKNSTRTIQ